MPARPQVLLADASVLIDYRDSNLSVLGLASVHVGQVRVVYEVLEEVAGFDVDLATTLGIEAVDVSTETLLEVDSLPHRLSRQDRLSYLVCRENDWICLTNDRHLRKLCDENGLRLCWGLELMADLVEREALTKEDALRTAETIHANNPHHISAAVLQRFRDRTS